MIIEADVHAPSGPRIWAIGGGKGGVGKSVITTNLAVAVARTGERVAVVDADLGGANLHTMVGVPSPRMNLSDFISRRVATLAEIMTPTPVENLWLISGAKAMLETANPNFGQKGKILRHIAMLDVDHVFLDLGAGTAFNVLDFFLVARKGILVVVPEATSVENAYFFIKAAYFRKLKQAQPRTQVKAAVDAVMNSEARARVRTPRDLMAQVMTVDADAGAALMEEASTFSPSIIVNRVERAEQARLGDEMGSACRDYFGIRLQCLGSFPADNLVCRSVDERRPAVDLFPQSSFAAAVRSAASAFVGVPTEAAG
ncbi:MAG: P-loop NTPase [Thermoanaerobaculales bacterium]|jgi:flagellar biosynthesis protein FlhG|nr:P-loop NTPase [Thermoanaerobaculales bacterium]